MLTLLMAAGCDARHSSHHRRSVVCERNHGTSCPIATDLLSFPLPSTRLLGNAQLFHVCVMLLYSIQVLAAAKFLRTIYLMANPGDFAYTVKQQADIVRIVGDYVKLRKAGAQNYSGLCPFHSEKTPSFSVHATRQFFHCFGCGASGDVFSFVQKIENITFPEALRAVALKLGMAMPKASFSTPAEAREASLRAVLLEIHERACAFFQESLRRPEGARAREYLAGRGLDDATIRAFRIGFAPDSGFLLRDRLRGEFDEEALRASGLFSWKESSQPSAVSSQEKQEPPDQGEPEGSSQKPEAPVQAMYSKFRNRVMFPIASEAGRVIAFTGRTLSTDEKAGPKY